MSDCCTTEPKKIKANQKSSCPKCLVKCKLVSTATVLQHLTFPLNLDLLEDNYFYCNNSKCEISYFSESGTLYKTTEIRDQQELQQGWLCYCFDISKQQYQDALDSGTASKIKNFVIAKTKAHQCACETRNPSGQCCLVDFKKMEK